MATPLRTESNLVGYLVSAITAAATSIQVVFRDKITGLQRTPLSTTRIFVIDKGTPVQPNQNYEIILCASHSTAAGVTTLATVTRGLAFSGTAVTAGTGNAHVANAEVGCADVHYLWTILASLLDGTASFSNTLDMGTNKILNLATPTADTDASTKKYVDDIAIAGSPDASTTAKGISKLSSVPAVPTNPIAVGDNDARVPTAIVSTSSGAGDVGKVASLNASGQFADGFIHDIWINESFVTAKGDLVTASGTGTPATLTVGANGKVLIADSGQTTGQIWAYPTIGSITASDDKWILTAGPRQTASTSYAKIWEYKVFHSGSVRAKFELKDAAGGTTVYGQVWKNGVAVGVEHSTSSATFQPYQDDVTCVSGDLIQLYQKVPTGADYAVVQNFGLYGTGLREPVLTV
jgi:hypothetical protein